MEPRHDQSRRVALVTGASSGIGLAIAHQLAEKQHHLLLIARRGERLAELAEELEAKHRVSVFVLPLDLTEPGAMDEIERFIESHALSVDWVVNNAGFGLVGRFDEINRLELINMIQLNVVALTELTRRLLPQMVSAGSGRILNVASAAAFQPAPLMAVYHATKAFVLFLSEALAGELRGTGVTVTALCPGPVGQTEFGNRTGTDKKVPGLGLVRVSAARVARAGISGAEDGRAIVVPGAIMKMASMISPRLPRNLVRKVTHRIQRSRVAPKT